MQKDLGERGALLQRSFSKLERAFRPDSAGLVDAVVQFALEGAQTVAFYGVLQGRSLKLVAGKAPAPAVTLTIDAADFEEMIAGAQPVMEILASGRLKLAGDLSLGMMLTSLFQFD